MLPFERIIYLKKKVKIDLLWSNSVHVEDPINRVTIKTDSSEVK
jgi:hypothetical protein